MNARMHDSPHARSILSRTIATQRALDRDGAEMAPWGAMDPVLGTNPWGIAIPRSKGNDPILLDMALTQSGKGMMRR